MNWSISILAATFIICHFYHHHVDAYRNQQINNQQFNQNSQENRGLQQQRGQIKPWRYVGFIGGPDSDRDGTIRKMWLLYRRFVGYLEIKTQGYTNLLTQRNDVYAFNKVPCIGDCPPTSYCDMGICRCKQSLMALHGTCWKHHDGVIEDAGSWELKKEQNRTINPLTVSCRDHRRCKEFDINMICPRNVKKCRCRPLVGMRWNPAEAECQVYVENICEKIVNGTVVDEEEDENEETDEEEREELDQLNNQKMQENGYQQNAGFDQYNDNNNNNPRDRFNQQYQDQYGQKRLRNQMQGEVVRKRPFGKGEDEEDEEIEEEAPKAEMLLKLKPWSAEEGHIKEAFCHDLTILYKNYTIEKEGGEYFFAPFKSTPAIVAIFIVFTVIITGVCCYAFTHTSKTASFFNSKFKTPKRADTPTDFHDVDDSDDEKPIGANSGGSGGAPNNRNVRLFSTPQHNPNNPFNATPERTVPVAKPVHYK